jgi:hypothetical protein
MSMTPAAGLTFGGGGGKPTCADTGPIENNPHVASTAESITLIASPNGICCRLSILSRRPPGVYANARGAFRRRRAGARLTASKALNAARPLRAIIKLEFKPAP